MRYDQITAPIETLLDLADISLDELIGWLKPVEEKMNCGDKGLVARLNLIELVVRVSSRLKLTGSGNSESSKEGLSSGKRGHGRGGGDTCGRASGSGGRGSGGSDIASDECC
jgi:hypothetical protein